MSREVLRIVDANLNRFGEGLRVLEDVSRLVLEDSELTEKFRGLRHRVLDLDPRQVYRLIQSRDAASDPGLEIEEVQQRAGGILGVATAGARRAEQALRVLEELAKMSVSAPGADILKQARFELYTLEKELVLKITRQDKRESLKGCYALMNTRYYPDAAGQVARVILGEGVKLIELDGPATEREELASSARQVRGLCDDYGALLFISHHLDVALASRADGLCLGRGDLSVPTSRELLPQSSLLGYRVRGEEDIRKVAEDIDFLIYGPTRGIPDPETIRIAKEHSLPVVVMGVFDRGSGVELVGAGACCLGIEITSKEPQSIRSKIRAAMEGPGAHPGLEGP